MMHSFSIFCISFWIYAFTLILCIYLKKYSIIFNWFDACMHEFMHKFMHRCTVGAVLSSFWHRRCGVNFLVFWHRTDGHSIRDNVDENGVNPILILKNKNVNLNCLMNWTKTLKTKLTNIKWVWGMDGAMWLW